MSKYILLLLLPPEWRRYIFIFTAFLIQLSPRHHQGAVGNVGSSPITPLSYKPGRSKLQLLCASTFLSPPNRGYKSFCPYLNNQSPQMPGLGVVRNPLEGSTTMLNYKFLAKEAFTFSPTNFCTPCTSSNFDFLCPFHQMAPLWELLVFHQYATPYSVSFSDQEDASELLSAPCFICNVQYMPVTINCAIIITRRSLFWALAALQIQFPSLECNILALATIKCTCFNTAQYISPPPPPESTGWNCLLVAFFASPSPTCLRTLSVDAFLTP